jgi:hypothetical protein
MAGIGPGCNGSIQSGDDILVDVFSAVQNPSAEGLLITLKNSPVVLVSMLNAS